MRRSSCGDDEYFGKEICGGGGHGGETAGGERKRMVRGRWNVLMGRTVCSADTVRNARWGLED